MDKGGGGVMRMTRKELVVKQVQYGEGRVEHISVKVENNNREMTIIVAYVTPKTRSWKNQVYENMIEDTAQNLSKMRDDERFWCETLTVRK